MTLNLKVIVHCSVQPVDTLSLNDPIVETKCTSGSKGYQDLFVYVVDDAMSLYRRR